MSCRTALRATSASRSPLLSSLDRKPLEVRMGTRTLNSCRARDLSALTALWWAWPASHRVAREGAGQARLVAVSQDNRRLLRSIAHAQRAPPFAAPGLEAPKARALPGYATPRKALAAETDARRRAPSHVSGVLIIRPRAISTLTRVERRSAHRVVDLQADRPGLRRRLTDDADRGSRRVPITPSTD